MLTQNREVLRPFQHTYVLLASLGDIASLWLMFWLAAHLRQVQLDTGYLMIGLAATFFYYVIANMRGLYQASISSMLDREVRFILEAWISACLLVIIGLFVVKATGDYSRIALTTWFIATPGVLIIQRKTIDWIMGYFNRHGAGRRVVIAGTGELGRKVSSRIQKNNWMGLRVTGYYDDLGPCREDLDAEFHGNLEQMIEDARAQKFDEIFIALPLRESHRIRDVILQLADSSVAVHFVPDVFVFSLLHARWRDLGGVASISVHDTPLYGGGGLIKRIEDIVVGSLILIGITPVLLAIAIAIKLTSPGPVIFKQRRYGLGGEEVMVWKFRSMTVCDNGDTIKQATKGDSRITPLGAFLRKTSLDELPQFINVLQGHMSIVGPRPHAVAHNELYRKDIHGYMLRHLVKPGITGWAQINGWRGETDTLEKMEKRVEYDLDYIRNWSLWLDIKIIFLTIFKGFINKNAY